MANCVRCKGEIAWKSVWNPNAIPPKSQWIPMVPEKDAATGDVVKASVANGKGRMVRRAVATQVRHVCGSVTDPVASTDPAVSNPSHPLNPPSPLPLPQPVDPLDMAAVSAAIRRECKAIIEGIVPPPPKRIIVHLVTGSGEVTVDVSEQHPMMGELIPLIAKRRHVYLSGPAGSGKTEGAIAACKAIGLEPEIMSMPGTMPGGIKGYDGPNGFVGTVVSRAFGNKATGDRGCPIIMDEFDRMLPETAAALNTILESRKMVIGGVTVTAGEDFFGIGTGNTDMRGATVEYTSARPLDYSTAARFAFLEWDYDLAFESRLVSRILPDGAHIPLVTWRRNVYNALKRDRVVKVLCGPREAIRIAEDLVTGRTLASAVASWVWRGLDKDQITRYQQEFPLPMVSVKK